MREPALKDVRRSTKSAKKDLRFLLREFYELKNIFTLLKYAQEARESGEHEHIEPILNELLKRIRTEERIDRRMSRVYQRMREDLVDVEKILENSYPQIVQKIKSLLEKAEVFNADLVKLGSKGGQIEQKLREAKKDPKKLDSALLLVQRSFKDVQGFEQVVNELIHIDLYLTKQGDRLEKSDITQELERMVQADQATRSGEKLEGIYSRMMGNNVDVYNTDRLKEILEHHDLTNPKDVQLAWVIVQHADHDPNFQEQMLKKLPLDSSQTKMKAYLQDRIMVNKGKKQRFATQARNIGSIIALVPIEGVKIESEFEEEARDWAKYAAAKDILDRTIRSFKNERLPKMLDKAEHYSKRKS